VWDAELEVWDAELEVWDAELEVWGANRKARLLEKVLERPITLELELAQKASA
jgi:hypothetical protein